MVAITTHRVKPKGYVGRHIAHRPSGLGLVKQLVKTLHAKCFGEVPEGATLSGLSLPTPVKVLDGITGHVVDDVEAYMKPYVAELDAIMARFRAGLATIPFPMEG